MTVSEIHPDNYDSFEQYAQDLMNVNVNLLEENQLRDLCIYMVQKADEKELLEVTELLW